MHVLAAATAIKQTVLGLPHSTEQGGSGFHPCAELPATGQRLTLNKSLSKAILLTVCLQRLAQVSLEYGDAVVISPKGRTENLNGI